MDLSLGLQCYITLMAARDRSSEYDICPVCERRKHMLSNRCRKCRIYPQSKERPSDLRPFVPPSSDHETLQGWISATYASLDVSIAQLSSWCGFGSETLRGICADVTRALSPSTQRKLHDVLGIDYAELERLRPSSATNSAQVERLAQAADERAANPSGVCDKCGKRHRKPPPPWILEATELYARGSSYDTIAARVGVSDTNVKHWLKHEGVKPRSRQEAATQNAYNHGHTEWTCEPRPCKCGCGQLTSGKIYQGANGVRSDARYVKGHPGRGNAVHRPRHDKRDLSHLGSGPWIEEVKTRLTQRRWSFKDLEERVGFPRVSILGRDRPKPELVLRVAHVLEIRPLTAFGLAGWPEPSPIGWKVLQCLQDGEKRQHLADRLGIGIETLRNWITFPWRPVAGTSLYKVAMGLQLTLAEVQAEEQRAEALAPNRHRAGKKAVQTRRARDPSIDREMGKRFHESTWGAQRPRMVAAIRRDGAKRRIEIAHDDLQDALEQGLSFGEIGARFNASSTTARDRAIEYGLWNGVSSAQRHARRRVEASAARAGQARAEQSKRRCQEAAQWLDDLDSGVFALSRQDVQQRFHISNSSAQELITSTKVRMRAENPSAHTTKITPRAACALARGRIVGAQSQRNRAFQKLDAATMRLGDRASDTALRRATGCSRDTVRAYREARSLQRHASPQ